MKTCRSDYSIDSVDIRPGDIIKRQQEVVLLLFINDNEMWHQETCHKSTCSRTFIICMQKEQKAASMSTKSNNKNNMLDNR